MIDFALSHLFLTLESSKRTAQLQKNRDELGVKIEDLKQQVLGSEDD